MEPKTETKISESIYRLLVLKNVKPFSIISFSEELQLFERERERERERTWEKAAAAAAAAAAQTERKYSAGNMVDFNKLSRPTGCRERDVHALEPTDHVKKGHTDPICFTVIKYI